jgi:glucose/arabinose dehydrogenase
MLQAKHVVTGFAQPVAFVDAQDGESALVVEQGGLIRRVRGGVIDEKPFADLRSLLSRSGGEQGLLGLALDPQFQTSRRLFVGYTGVAQSNTVAELRAAADGKSVPPQKPRVLLAIDDFAANHNGGHVVVGPDGHLWIGTGDGGGGGDPKKTSQDEGSQLGKMLRIAINGPEGAPAKVSMWAKGLRNPWRYAFDPSSGDLWIADVGQNAWEEVNVVPAAATRTDPKMLNFGWSIVEGDACFRSKTCVTEGFVKPVFTYGHDDKGGCSVSGGVVVDGTFVFADYCSGTVWGARREGAAVEVRRLFASDRRVTSFGLDHAGRLWLVDHGGAVVLLGP